MARHRARPRPRQPPAPRRRSRASRRSNRRIPSRSSARRPAASTPKAEGITPPRAASRAGTPRCSSRAGLLIGVAAAVAAARGDRNRMCLPAAAVQQHRGPFFVRPPPALPPRHPPRMWHRPPLLERRIRPSDGNHASLFNRAWRETDVFWCACRPSCVAGGFWGPKAAIPARGRRSQPPCAPQEHGLPEDTGASSEHTVRRPERRLCAPVAHDDRTQAAARAGVGSSSCCSRSPSEAVAHQHFAQSESRGNARGCRRCVRIHGRRTRRWAAADLPSCSCCF